MTLRASACLLAGLTALAAPCLAGHLRTVTLPDRTRIVVDVPAGYSFETEQNQVGATLITMDNPVWRINAKVLVVPENDRENTTRSWQENRLITFMADTLSEAAEKDYSFKPLNPRKGTGVVMIFTDPRVAKKQPLPPGEYAYLTGGVKGWRGVTVMFQMLSMDLTSEEYLEMMRVFTHSFEKG